MYAIVEIAGDQYKVEPENLIKVPYLKTNIGDIVEFNKIFTIADGDNIKIGTPTIEGSITAKVIKNGKDEKVLVFHKKRRKGYQKLNGHRQAYSVIDILSFDIPGFEYKKEIKEAQTEKEELIFEDTALNDTQIEEDLSNFDLAVNDLNINNNILDDVEDNITDLDIEEEDNNKN